MSLQRDQHLVEQAVECIKRLLRSGFNERGEAWIKAWYRHDLKWSDGRTRYVTIPKDHLSSLISAAQDDREVFELMCFVVGTRLIAGAAIPLQLREFAGSVLTGRVSRPKGKRGRGSQWGRNFIIIRTMKEINPGILFEGEDARHPTANLDQRGVRRRDLSAMEIVHEALQHTEIGLVDKKSINDIWSSQKWQTAHDEAYSLLLGGRLDDLDDVARI
jgi:hypothetical protein